MDITELVDRVTQKYEEKENIRMHPYGFLQLSLSEVDWRDSGYRLHVWSAELPPMRRPEFTVHNHVYQVHSRVLLGELKDTQYAVKENPEGEYVVFRAADGKLVNTEMNVSYREKEVSAIRAGGSYFVDKWVFHSSESLAPLTATLFRKLNADADKAPLVIGPRTYQNTEILADERGFDQDLAWKVVMKAVENLRSK